MSPHPRQHARKRRARTRRVVPFDLGVARQANLAELFGAVENSGENEPILTEPMGEEK